MQQAYIDEISLLLTPTIINQTVAPSVFEHTGATPAALQKFILKDVTKLDKHTVWIRWVKTS
jgi:riboflavin biosynthesis pyrimidine reductase